MACHRSIISNVLYSTDHDADIVGLVEKLLYPSDSATAQFFVIMKEPYPTCRWKLQADIVMVCRGQCPGLANIREPYRC